VKYRIVVALACALVLSMASVATTSAQTEVRLRAEFTATAAGGPADGHADWRREGARTRLSVEVEDVTRDGTGRVVILRGTTVVFSRAINIVGGFSDLNLDTANGNVVPALRVGDVVRIRDSSGALILVGRFQLD
jgi:hypothetical protein